MAILHGHLSVNVGLVVFVCCNDTEKQCNYYQLWQCNIEYLLAQISCLSHDVSARYKPSSGDSLAMQGRQVAFSCLKTSKALKTSQGHLHWLLHHLTKAWTRPKCREMNSFLKLAIYIAIPLLIIIASLPCTIMTYKNYKINLYA